MEESKKPTKKRLDRPDVDLRLRMGMTFDGLANDGPLKTLPVQETRTQKHG
jgi:hypothetical protein